MSEQPHAAPSGPPLALSDFVPFRIVSLGQAMGTRLARDYAEEFGISMSEWRTLAVIGQYDDVTAARVVAETPMDKVAVSRATARLVEKELVERVPRRDDRRSWHLRLTGQGAGVFHEVSARAIRAEEEMLSVLSDDERSTLVGLLSKLEEGVGG